MTHPVPTRFRWLLLCVVGGVLASVAATGCSSDGYSPSCPPLPLYDVRDAAPITQTVQAARLASEKAHCSTPIGDASTGVVVTTPADAGGQ